MVSSKYIEEAKVVVISITKTNFRNSIDEKFVTFTAWEFTLHEYIHSFSAIIR